MQDCNISIANTLEILQSCPKPSNLRLRFCGNLSLWWLWVAASTHCDAVRAEVIIDLVQHCGREWLSAKQAITWTNIDLLSIGPHKLTSVIWITVQHDDVIKWKHFPCYWPFVRGIHRSPVNFRHKGQWHGALMFSFICAWINSWVNNGGAGDLRRHHACPL